MTSSQGRQVIRKILIVTGSFMLYFVSMGIAKSFGIIYTELLDYFRASKSDTSWIPSIGTGLILSFGPFAGMLEEKYGCRTIVILGSILISIGLAASSFVNNMYLLYLTYGIITENRRHSPAQTASYLEYGGLNGIGFSLCHVAANVVVNVYFDKKRVLAVGISSAGSGIGTTVLPILGSYLLDVYQWQGTLLILSGIGLQGLYCGVLFGDLGASTKKSAKDAGNNIHVTFKSTCEMKEGKTGASNVDTIWKKTKHILSSRKFVLFIISAIFVNLGYLIPFVMLPDMVAERRISKTNAALLITTSGISSILSRIVFGFISDFPFCNRLLVNSVSLIILGITTCLCVVLYNEYLFFLYSSILGIVTGLFGMYQSVIAVDIVGKEYVGLAFGYLTFLGGIAIVVGPPLAGFLYDVTGDYILSFLCCGIFFCIGGIFSFIATYIKSSQRKYSFEEHTSKPTLS